MTNLKKLMLVLFSSMIFMGLQSCEEGAFEEAGENVDEGVEETGEAFENAGDEIDEEI